MIVLTVFPSIKNQIEYEMLRIMLEIIKFKPEFEFGQIDCDAACMPRRSGDSHKVYAVSVKGQGKIADGHGGVEICIVETHTTCTQFPLRFKGKWSILARCMQHAFGVEGPSRGVAPSALRFAFPPAQIRTDWSGVTRQLEVTKPPPPPPQGRLFTPSQ